MNIFVLDLDSTKAAQYHCDAHVNKMMLESAQMACTVMNNYCHTGWRSTHANHPCTKWVGRSWSNFEWLFELTEALQQEAWYRRPRSSVYHQAYEKMVALYDVARESLPHVGLTPFAQCMPDMYKSDDVVAAYREYYFCEKYHLHKWTRRGAPSWIGDF